MAEPTFEDVESWLIANADKKGTTDYVQMANAYKALDPQRTPSTAPAAPAKSFGEDMWSRAKMAFGMPAEAPPAGTPQPESIDISDIMTAKRLTSDPYSAENTASRVLTGAIGGIPDLGIAVYNAGARAIGSPESQGEYLTPKMQANAGTAALPADAPWYRTLGEAAGSGFLGGGAGAAGSVVQGARTVAGATGAAVPVVGTAVRAAAPTVVPTVAGHYGGEVGAALGRNYLGDEETGRLLGSLLTGAGAGVATNTAVMPAARTVIHQRYAGAGRPDAPELAAAAQRQGVTPTAGMLGDDTILRREQVLSGQGGSANIIQDARNTARTGIGDAYDRAATARGSTDMQPTPGTIGYDVANIARQATDDANARSSRGQQQLMVRTGPRTDMDVGPIEQAILRLRGETDPLTAAPLEARLASLRTMIERNPANFDVDGNQIASNIPYQQGKDFRTNLRTSGEGYRPVTGHHAETVYDAATNQMRNTAAGQGVPPGYFDTVQGRTAALTGEGGPVQTFEPISNPAQPMPAYNFVRSGEQAPNQLRMLENTGNPDVGRALGDYMRLIGNQTINNPAGGARGPINLANRWSGMTPDARQVIAGSQLDNVGDTVGLARALNIPTQQNGLTRALGGQGEGVGRMLIGSETLGQLGGAIAGAPGNLAGRIAGVLGMPGIRSILANILEGPTVRNALSGGQSPGGINQLGAALTAIQADQQQARVPTTVRR